MPRAWRRAGVVEGTEPVFVKIAAHETLAGQCRVELL